MGMESKSALSGGTHCVKLYRIISPTCFIGCYGRESDLEECVCRVQGDPYSFDEVNIDLVTVNTEFICFSTNAGCWGRAKVLECLDGSTQFRVRMTDFLEDESATPIFDVVSWNNVRAMPPKMSVANVPSLGGVFYLRDPEESNSCCHVVDNVRMQSLLEELLDSNDVYKCVIDRAISPQASIVDIYLHLPLIGSPNGKLQIPFIVDKSFIPSSSCSVGPPSLPCPSSPCGVDLEQLRDLVLYGAVMDARSSALSLLESVIRAQERGIPIPADLFNVRSAASIDTATSEGGPGLEDIEDDSLQPPEDFVVDSESSCAPPSLQESVAYRKETWSDDSPARPTKKKEKKVKKEKKQAGDHLFQFSTSASNSPLSLSPCKRCGICGGQNCQCRVEELWRKH